MKEQADTPNITSSSEDEIKILSGISAIRLRPEMYIGSTSSQDGLHHLFYEILDNALDEHLAGFCSKIIVTLESEDTISVEDDGRGISVAVHSAYVKEGLTQLEIALTQINAGGKFNDKLYKSGSGGLHGIGSCAVNSLSKYLKATVHRDSSEYQQEFSEGLAITKTIRIGNSKKHGTKITFTPDDTIFIEGVKFNKSTITNRLKECAMLNGGLQIKFVDAQSGDTETFFYAGGISDYVSNLNVGKSNPYPMEVISGSGKFYHPQYEKTVEISFALQYAEDDSEIIKTFANNINNTMGGTHLTGFKNALTRVVNSFARSSGLLKEKTPNLSGDDIRSGITAIISAKLTQPKFESQTKIRLTSPEVEAATNSIVSEKLTEYFEKNPTVIKLIVERALESFNARTAAKNAFDLIKRKTVLGKNYRLPGKLKDCRLEDKNQTEIFIVEGDSALGSASNGRDSNYQALLPLRGKILNVEKSDQMSILKNQEINNLISALGVGVLLDKDNDDESFNIDNLRYGKIIILTDADVDGAHISTLLLNFFYRFMPEIIFRGHLYIALPPLYKCYIDKNIHYAWSTDERDSLIAKGAKRITRFKGLGEMDGDELRDTTLDKSKRVLMQVNVKDKSEAEQMLSVLMSSNVAARKEHIIRMSQLQGEDNAED